MRSVYGFLFLTVCSGLFSSCILFSPAKATKELVYFNAIDSMQAALREKGELAVIRKNDKLYIGVHSIQNDTEARKFNLPNYYAGTNAINPSITSAVGYDVDENGDIQFPILGNVKAEGMTKFQLQEYLKKALSSELLSPIVNVRIINFRVSVLGEVARAGAFEVPDEHITLLEALGLAGDLTPYARRDNVLVIQEKDGKKEMGRVDLNKVNALNSPYYYLQQDDVIYVEPSKRKLPNADQTAIRNLSILSSVISSLALVITLFLK